MASSTTPFPIVDRVVFANNPLHEVVCEFRFPTILKIDSEPPASFQELVRHKFPLLAKQAGVNLPTLPPQVANALAGAIPKAATAFKTEDDLNELVLSSESLVIRCRSYNSWDEFKENILLAHGALRDVYAPNFYLRVGLRYINLIKRSGLNLGSEPWSELLNPRVAGELAEPSWNDCIVGLNKNVRCNLPFDDDLMIFQHGLVSVDDDPEIVYALDFDYIHNSKLDATDVDGAIERLHGYSGSAFQWCISERLKLALS